MTVLNKLENRRKTPLVAAALDRRKQLVHGLAFRRWESLGARRRVQEVAAGVGRIEEVMQAANIEALIEEGRSEIDRMCETLATFREDLIKALKGSA